MNKTDYITGGKILNAKVISDEEPVITQEKSVEITENGITLVEPDSGYNAMTVVEVTTNVNPDLESKSVTITSNGTSTVTPTAGKDGLSSVEITTNVTPPLESKSVEFTENGTTIITPTEGKYGLSSVEVTVNTPYVPDLEKDVNFFDYDGTLLYAYTKSEFLALENLPAVPTHDRLTSGAWNWTLSDAKTFVSDNNWLDIGAIYDITSGKSEMDVKITPATGKTINLYTDGTKDWGDGTTDTNTSHTYTDYGSYTIIFEGNVNKTSTGYNIFGETFENINTSSCLINLRSQRFTTSQNLYAYCPNLKSVVLSSDFYINSNIFNYDPNLKYISLRGESYYSYNTPFYRSGLEICSSNMISSDMTIGLLSNCPNLKRGIVYKSLNKMFYECMNLKKVIIPSTINSISQLEFYYCSSLEEINFPRITSIYQNSNIFAGCSNLKKIDFTKCTSVPAITTNTLGGINPDVKIVVPDSLYNSWISATNWSNYAGSIVRESDYNA